MDIPRHRSLSSWLEYVIDDLKIHDRGSWADILGCKSVDGWIDGTDVPNPHQLKNILALLRERYVNKSEEALSAWNVVSCLPLHQSLTLMTQQSANFATLASYVLHSYWEDLRMAMGALPLKHKERLLDKFIVEAHQTYRSLTQLNT